MKKFLLGLLLLVSATTQAQDYTSGNLIGSHNLTGTVPTTSEGGGFSGGGTPGYNSATNTILFGYTQSTAAYTYAVNQALRDSGIVFTGYNYSWEYYNQNDSYGTLSATVNFTSTSGVSLYSRTWALGTTTTGWTSVSGTETFTNNILTSNLSSFGLSFTGIDGRFWAGYYGPQVRNPSLSVNYTFDPCTTNPLSSPSCPGYTEAYKTQQCSVSALYDPTCPGYAAAYLTYQCSIDPLYSTTCPGYTQAYYNQQCTINPLYDTGCSGYKEAYALKNIVQPTTTTTVVVAQVTTDPVASAAPIVADPVVNSVVTTKSSTTNADANPAAAVKVTQSSAPATTTAADSSAEKKSDSKSTSTASTTENKPSNKPQTAREALAEKQREAAKKDAVAKAKNLANDMAKAADMEAQVAVQNVVIQAMGYTPGFDVYGRATLPDNQFYKPYEAYPGQRNIDTPSGRGLFGGSDRVHQGMVDQQYNLGK